MSTEPRRATAPGRSVRGGQAALAIAMGLLVLLLGGTLTHWLPSAEEVGREPFMRSAGIKEPVEMRTGTVTVTGLRAASHVDNVLTSVGTPGVWLIVDVEFTARGKQSYLGMLQLRGADGRTYGGYQVVPHHCGPGQPGIPIVCEIPMEVPVDALEGATLLIPAGPRGTQAPDDVAEVHLGLDAAAVAELTTDAPTVELRQPALKGMR